MAVRCRLRAVTLAFVVALGAMAPASVAQAAGAAKPVTHTIVIDAVVYQPASLSVKRGDTVIWVNKDPFPHTITAAGAFDSGNVASGASWKLVARRSGRFDYICTLHPNMKGTLSVE